MQLVDKRILILSPNFWGDMQISKHHYASILASLGNEVYFLNPPSLNANFFEVTKISKNLNVINYKPIFRGGGFLPKFLFDWLVKAQIKYIEFKIGGNIDVLWSFTTSIYYNLSWFHAKLRIFHPVDQLNNPKKVKIGNEADIAFTCSEFILQELNGLSCPKYLIPHGLSPSFVNYTFEDWSKSDQLNVCYIGNLFIKNLDRTELKRIIKGHSGHIFHFIGALDPKDSNISSWIAEESLSFVKFLEESSNVVVHGKVASHLIPTVIKNMDAFLVCYVQDKANVISNSHKILEYLSTGRVVISSFVNQYKGTDLVQMLNENDSEDLHTLFGSVISNIDINNSKENQNQRKEYAMNNSYRSNVSRIEQSILKLH